MKKVLLSCFIGVVLNAEVVSAERAAMQGKGQATVINFKVDSPYEEKIKECEELKNLPILVNVENREEVMPIVINSCKEALKK